MAHAQILEFVLEVAAINKDRDRVHPPILPLPTAQYSVEHKKTHHVSCRSKKAEWVMLWHVTTR
jgi:hypothetical protein